MPENVKQGDLLILHDYAVTSPTFPTSVLPAGFTLIDDAQGTSTYTNRSIITAKIASSSDAGSLITGMNGNYQTVANQKELLVFRANNPLVGATIFSKSSQATDVAPSNQTVLSSEGQSPSIVLAAYSVGGTVGARGFSPARDGELTANTNSYFAFKIYNGTLSDVTVSMPDGGSSNILQSLRLACY